MADVVCQRNCYLHEGDQKYICGRDFVFDHDPHILLLLGVPEETKIIFPHYYSQSQPWSKLYL